MEVFRNGLNNGIHQALGTIGGGILEGEMVRTAGNDFITRKELHQVVMQVVEAVFCKKRRLPNRNYSTVHLVIMRKINIKDSGHQRCTFTA